MTNYEFFKDDIISLVSKMQGMIRLGNRLMFCYQRDCLNCKESCVQRGDIADWLNAEHIGTIRENVYIVSTFKNRKEVLDVRTPGYYFTLNDAIMCVTKNIGDIYEGLYKCAVIEEVRSGVYPSVYRKWWYEWDTEQQKYVEIDAKDIDDSFKYCSCVLG